MKNQREELSPHEIWVWLNAQVDQCLTIIQEQLHIKYAQTMGMDHSPWTKDELAKVALSNADFIRLFKMIFEIREDWLIKQEKENRQANSAQSLVDSQAYQQLMQEFLRLFPNMKEVLNTEGIQEDPDQDDPNDDD